MFNLLHGVLNLGIPAIMVLNLGSTQKYPNKGQHISVKRGGKKELIFFIFFLNFFIIF